MTRLPLPLVVLGCVLTSAAGEAHDTWIVATAEGGLRPTLRLDMTSGMAFPALESGIKPERVVRAMLREGGKAAPLPAPAAAKASLRYSLPLLAEPGVAVFWIELAPRALELRPELVGEYLREIGQTEEIGPRWRARPDPKRWREVYRKHAKTFLRTSAGGADESAWREPVGMDLELVPENDPTALVSASALSLVLLKNGQPLPGLKVAAERGEGQERRRTFATSDAHGRVSFTLDRPGPWLFAATELREAGTEWSSDFTTLTVAVAPARR